MEPQHIQRLLQDESHICLHIRQAEDHDYRHHSDHPHIQLHPQILTRMKRLICIFALAAAVACETEYPSLNGMGDSPIVHIQALPGLRDTMTLIVETAHPIGSSHEADSPEEVRVKVDKE